MTVCDTPGVLLEPEPSPEVVMSVTFITGGRLDWVGIATVVSRGFDVVVRMVASGPIVMGTPKIAQSSATTKKVSVHRISSVWSILDQCQIVLGGRGRAYLPCWSETLQDA